MKVSTGISRVSRRSRMKGTAAAVPEFLHRKVSGAVAVWLEGSWGDLP